MENKSVLDKPSAGDSIASSISDGDTTHSPDGNSVFDALALKAPLNPSLSNVYVTADASAQSIPDNTETIIEFNTEVTDTLGEFNIGTYKFTAQNTGLFIVSCKITWTLLPDGVRAYSAIKKGVTYLGSSFIVPGNTANVSVMTMAVMSLTAADVVDFYCQQMSGGNISLAATTNCQLYIAQLR